ncbi:MAG: hypothetical protein WBJ41_05915 [Chromatiaceae bacterium]
MVASQNLKFPWQGRGFGQAVTPAAGRNLEPGCGRVIFAIKRDGGMTNAVSAE